MRAPNHCQKDVFACYMYVIGCLILLSYAYVSNSVELAASTMGSGTLQFVDNRGFGEVLITRKNC
jgi:hypothetical protein